MFHNVKQTLSLLFLNSRQGKRFKTENVVQYSEKQVKNITKSITSHTQFDDGLIDNILKRLEIIENKLGVKNEHK